MEPSRDTKGRLRRVWLWAAIVALAVTSGVLWMIIARGRSAMPHVILQASARGEAGAPRGPARRVGELPAHDDVRVSSRDYLQLSYAGLASPAFVTLVAIDETGAEHPYLPRADAEPLRVPPSRDPRALEAVYLGRQRPGRFRLYAVFSEGPLEARAIREAAARAAARGQPDALDGIAAFAVVSGPLVIEP